MASCTSTLSRLPLVCLCLCYADCTRNFPRLFDHLERAFPKYLSSQLSTHCKVPTYQLTQINIDIWMFLVFGHQPSCSQPWKLPERNALFDRDNSTPNVTTGSPNKPPPPAHTRSLHTHSLELARVHIKSHCRSWLIMTCSMSYEDTISPWIPMLLLWRSMMTTRGQYWLSGQSHTSPRTRCSPRMSSTRM